MDHHKTRHGLQTESPSIAITTDYGWDRKNSTVMLRYSQPIRMQTFTIDQAREHLRLFQKVLDEVTRIELPSGPNPNPEFGSPNGA